MKRAIAIGTMLAFVASQALAAAAPACDNSGQLTGQRLTMMLPGKYVCVGTSPNATWNEMHSGAANNTGSASGTITDYKRGPGDPVDPQQQVGTYSISGGTGAGQVTYDYGSGVVYSFYAKMISPSSLLFCPMQSGMELVVNVQNGNC